MGSEVPRSDPGSLYATRSVLWKAVDYLTYEQRELLYDIFKGTLADLRASWGSESGSVFGNDFLDELEKITFRLAQSPKLREGDGNRSLVREFVCIRCFVAMSWQSDMRPLFPAHPVGQPHGLRLGTYSRLQPSYQFTPPRAPSARCGGWRGRFSLMGEMWGNRIAMLRI